MFNKSFVLFCLIISLLTTNSKSFAQGSEQLSLEDFSKQVRDFLSNSLHENPVPSYKEPKSKISAPKAPSIKSPQKPTVERSSMIIFQDGSKPKPIVPGITPLSKQAPLDKSREKPVNEEVKAEKIPQDIKTEKVQSLETVEKNVQKEKTLKAKNQKDSPNKQVIKKTVKPEVERANSGILAIANAMTFCIDKMANAPIIRTSFEDVAINFKKIDNKTGLAPDVIKKLDLVIEEYAIINKNLPVISDNPKNKKASVQKNVANYTVQTKLQTQNATNQTKSQTQNAMNFPNYYITMELLDNDNRLRGYWSSRVAY